MSEIVNNKRIAKNTVYLYMRTLVVIVINLYASRVILATLGIEDYGIYNVVAGVVAMFGFLNNAMVASSQRFISFEQGRSDIERQKDVYSTSILIHLTIAVVILFIAETVGLWFLNNKMNIPDERMIAANWVYQGAILTFIFKIINTPNQASVIAHEHMHFFAIVSVLDAILQLAIIYVLKVFTLDKLILYSLLLLGIAFLNLLLYRLYTISKFKECRFKIVRDFTLFKEMFAFSGWSFMGNFGIAMSGPAVNIIVNIFCGPAVNAARGIANQVSAVTRNFVSSYQQAVNPQITKRYAAGEIESMKTLVRYSSKFSFYLFAIIVVPLFVRADYVLNLWLEEVPEFTLEFLQLTLIAALVTSMVEPFTTGIQATGKIMVFQIVIMAILFINLPLSYMVLNMGMPPYSVMYASIFTEVLALLSRMILMNYYVKIDLKDFVVSICLHNTFTGFLMFLVPVLVNHYIPQTFFGLILVCLFSIIWSIFIIISIGFSKREKSLVFSLIRSRIFKDREEV